MENYMCQSIFFNVLGFSSMTKFSKQTQMMRELTVHWIKAQPVLGAFIGTLIKDRHHAEDIMQQVAQTVAEKYDTYEGDRPFTPWAIGIARNKVMNYQKKYRRDKHQFDSEVLKTIAEVNGEMGDVYDERKKALDDCISKLEGRNRAVIELRYLKDMKTSEISGALGLSNNAIFVLLHRVRAVLGKCVSQRVSVPSRGDV